MAVGHTHVLLCVGFGHCQVSGSGVMLLDAAAGLANTVCSDLAHGSWKSVITAATSYGSLHYEVTQLLRAGIVAGDCGEQIHGGKLKC